VALGTLIPRVSASCRVIGLIDCEQRQIKRKRWKASSLTMKTMLRAIGMLASHLIVAGDALVRLAAVSRSESNNAR